MPGAAVNAGAVERVLPLHEIADQVLEWVAERGSANVAARA
jgi:chemotaxis response regulator CheB